MTSLRSMGTAAALAFKGKPAAATPDDLLKAGELTDEELNRVVGGDAAPPKKAGENPQEYLLYKLTA
jgi:hypothetical protein